MEKALYIYSNQHFIYKTSTVWNPYLHGDKSKIELIQQRGDLIQTYKFLNGIDFINLPSTYFLDEIKEDINK